MSDILLSSILFSTYRRRALGLLLLHPDKTYHVQEIARLTKTAPGTLSKELAKLSQAGLLTREWVGNQLRYAANRKCPVFEEMASIMRKTSGLADLVFDALALLEKQITIALIFGSVARGKERAGSDVDVLIIGKLGFANAVKALHPVQDKIGREINPVVMSPVEFQRKQEEGDGFVRELLAQKKLFLIGDEDELEKLGHHQPPGAA
jgi:predicted nucleotidyltransferase